MKRIVVLAVALVALVSITASGSVLASTIGPASVSGAALAVSTTLNPVADAYVDSTLPSTNYGSSTQIRVDGSPIVNSYLRFDVSGVSGSVSQATLRIYANSGLNSGVTAKRVADNTWGEGTINYGNAPAIGSALGTSSVVTAGTWVTFDVTSYVTGNGTFSFAITSTNVTALSLASRESANKPELVVTTATAATPTATSIVPPTATTVPPTATSVPPTATPGGTGTSLTVSPEADAYVDASASGTNYGASTELRVDGSPVVRSYLRFAVSGLSGSVSQATLRLYANSALNSGITVNRVTDNTWGENTINYANAPAVGSAIASSAAIRQHTWVVVDVTSYVNGSGTFSFALTGTNSKALSLASREAANKPQLVVTTGSVTPPTATPTSVAPPTATPVPPTATPVPPTATPAPPTNTPTPSGSDPILLVTGDSRTGCNTGATATANLLANYSSSTLLLFNGDATSTGAYSEFTDCFNTTFGKYKAQIRPVPGNHEYGVSGASGYFTYYGAQAHSPGYYSFDVGTWHIVALNSEIDISSTSAQMSWLKNDLTAHPAACTIAYWHEPRWSSGSHGNNTFVSALWQTLYDNNVELAFNGHDHDYERFAPQNPSGALDNARGITEFVIGNAGAPPYAFSTIQPNSQARMTGAYGLVQLTLHPSSYDYKWIGATGSFTDAGSAACH